MKTNTTFEQMYQQIVKEFPKEEYGTISISVDQHNDSPARFTLHVFKKDSTASILYSAHALPSFAKALFVLVSARNVAEFTSEPETVLVENINDEA